MGCNISLKKAGVIFNSMTRMGKWSVLSNDAGLSGFAPDTDIEWSNLTMAEKRKVCSHLKEVNL